MLATLFFVIFTIRGVSTERINVTTLQEGHLETTGSVTGIPRINGDLIQFQVHLENGERLQTSGLLKDEDQQQKWSELRPGERCLFYGKLSKPNEPTNFFQYNYASYLYDQTIHWVYQIEPQKVVCNDANGTWTDQFNRWRMDRMAQIRERYHEETAGLIIALTYGDRYFIDQDILQAYQRLGVIHLLAVSGLHVGMLTACAMYVLIRFGMTRERSMELLMVGLPFYAIIAGAAPPVIRAAAMSFVVLLCLRLKKRIHPMIGISLTCLIFLLLKPYSLFQLGFQLSFLVSFSLILSAQTIQTLYTSYLLKTLAVTFIAQLVTLPLILFHFFEWNLISLPLNLIYIPFVTIIVLPASFLSSLFDLILPGVFNLPYYFLQLVVPPVHNVLLFINQYPVGAYTPGKLSGWQLVSLYAVILIVLLLWESQIKIWWIPAMISLAIVLGGIKLLPYFQKEAVVTMLDVGQGDSFVIELPRREAVLVIDTGGVIRFSDEPWQKRRNQFDTGKDILVPYLKAKGITTIDTLVLTHGDHDHIGGAQGLLGKVAVRELLYGKGPVEKENEKQVLEAYLQAGTTIHMVEAGQKRSYGNNEITIIAPVASDFEQDINERSIVLAASLEGIHWLFTGDLGEKGEHRLMERYPHLSVDILKAGHHGSLTSSSELFLDHIKPKAVLISAGRNNRYGHPHPDILNRFEESQVVVMRTDLNGAVQFKLKDKKIRVESAIEQKETGPQNE